MPAYSCRDVDEVCDWFFRDHDPARLVVTIFQHDEEAHLPIRQQAIAMVCAGILSLADEWERSAKTFRWDDVAASAKKSSLRCRDIGTDCSEVFEGEDFVVAVVKLTRHLEKNHIDFWRDLLVKMPLSEIFENVRLAASR